MTSYTSRARREAEWWIIQCDEAPGAISQVRRQNEAAFAQREAIAFVLGVSPQRVDQILIPERTTERKAAS